MREGVEMRTIDRRTRRDSDVTTLDAPTFFQEELPALLERHGALAARGLAHLGAPPLTIDVGGYRRTVACDESGMRLVTQAGDIDDAIVVELEPQLFSEWGQQRKTFNAMIVAGQLAPTDGQARDLAAWDAVWHAVLEGWAVVDDDLSFRDRHGEPLDLHRHFTPADDPADVAHFLREAGYVHLHGWLDPEIMQTIAVDFERALPAYAPGDGRSWWATLADGTEHCVRLQHFVEHSPTTVELLTSDRWQQIRTTLAGDDPLVQDPVEGNCIEALVKPIGVVKGISDIPWHRDCNFGRHAYGCASTTVGVSVTAGGRESGQLRVVAGSHRVGMPAMWAFSRSRCYLPIVPLPTEAGDLTVHLSCTLHEAQPPVTEERLVMYTGFRLTSRDGDRADGGNALSELREKAQYLTSQPPSPVVARP